MSLPRLQVLVLSSALLATAGLTSCKSNSKKVIDDGPKKTEQAYFASAQQALAKDQYGIANKHLEAIDTYYPTGQFAQQAQLELLYSRLKQSDYTGVIALAERFIRLNPTHPSVDYAYYLRGVANMEMNYDGLLRYTSLQSAHRDTGYIKLAFNNFAELIQRFPRSEYAVDAAERMNFISQELAESEINVARFNLRRKAWLAAVQRARWVFEYYPNSPQIPEAIATMAYGYQKLGDSQTSQQYKELLKLNYPNLLRSNGDVNIKAAQGQGSLLNRATLGVLGKDAQDYLGQRRSKKLTSIKQSNQGQRSLTNRLSFGLLGKDKSTDTKSNQRQFIAPSTPVNSNEDEPSMDNETP